MHSHDTDRSTRQTPNRLAEETSAYLRQHMDNPVDWWPWCPEALAEARKTDKPLLISIGYSACHWCHVMAHESFEDPETAALMNRLFVNIKVDREERPDVDQIYMDTVVGLTGHGGWPLTVFCRPDGAPFHGGTYYPPTSRHGLPSFREVLTSVDSAYRGRRESVDQTAERIVSGLARPPAAGGTTASGVLAVTEAAMRLLQQADPDHGGFGTAPKFPTPPNLLLLLSACDELPPHKAKEALEHVILSCREMARGGIYDHLGGGFHRYSVDDNWGVPHFEKMLYDQGQLLSVYAEVLRRGAEPADELAWPIRETVDFLRREMTGPEGGLFASLDADSEGEEGTFYVWTIEQIEQVLGAQDAVDFCAAHGVTARGNFERGTTVLRELHDEGRERFANARRRLLEMRNQRVRPGTDLKRVASWNALTISGLARASSIVGDPTLLDDAVAVADFMLENMHDANGRLLRVWNQGRAHVPAFLDDHAALLGALLDLHRAGADDRFLGAAARVARDIADRFFDGEQGDLFLTPADGEVLLQRPRSDHDGATPHSTGLATLGLLRVASQCGRPDLREIADRVLVTHGTRLERAPESVPTLARAALAAERGLSTAVIVGARNAASTDALAQRARWLLSPEDAVLVCEPGTIPDGVDPSWLQGRNPVDGRPTAYMCRGSECSLPVTDPERLDRLPNGANA